MRSAGSPGRGDRLHASNRPIVSYQSPQPGISQTCRREDVALYYDELHRWTARDQDFQVFSGRESDTIHRFLIDADTGAFSPDTIYKFVDPHIATLTPIRGLDAGSGYGGTCFRCLHVHGGHWTGVTISPEQWTERQRQLRRRAASTAASTFICRRTTQPCPAATM